MFYKTNRLVIKREQFVEKKVGEIFRMACHTPADGSTAHMEKPDGGEGRPVTQITHRHTPTTHIHSLTTYTPTTHIESHYTYTDYTYTVRLHIHNLKYT